MPKQINQLYVWWDGSDESLGRMAASLDALLHKSGALKPTCIHSQLPGERIQFHSCTSTSEISSASAHPYKVLQKIFELTPLSQLEVGIPPFNLRCLRQDGM